MGIRNGFVALGLQCLAIGAAAAGIQKRQEESSVSKERVTVTQRVTRERASTPLISAVTNTDSAGVPIVTEPAQFTTTIAGETIIVQTTLTRPCTECAGSVITSVERWTTAITRLITLPCDECPEGTTVIETTQTETQTSAESSALGVTTGDDSTPTPNVYTTTVTIPCESCPDGSTVVVKTETSAPEGSGSIILSTGNGGGGVSTQTGIYTNITQAETTAVPETTGGDSEGNGSSGSESTPVATGTGETTSAQPTTTGLNVGTDATFASTGPSVILSTGGSGSDTTLSRNTGIFSNGTGTVPTLTATDATAVPTDATEGGNVITRTVTRDGSIVTQTATVTATVGQPQIVIIQQITVFIFYSGLGSNCPPVTPNDNGGFVVDNTSFDNLGDACSSACYKQFSKCTANAGKNYAVKDCQTQLGACMKAASTQTVTAAPVTITQTVILPPDCSTASDIVTDGSIISSMTLTGGEIATIGTGGVSVVTATFTQVTATGVESSADATLIQTTSIPQTISQIETTQGVTVTKIDEEGSVIVSIITMTLTIPANNNNDETTASGTQTTIEGSQTIEVGTTVTSTSDVSTVTLPPSGTRTTAEISVIKTTYTITVTGSGVTKTGATEIGVTETQATGTVVTQTGETSADTTATGLTASYSTTLITMTLPPVDGTGTGLISVVTMTITGGTGPTGTGSGPGSSDTVIVTGGQSSIQTGGGVETTAVPLPGTESAISSASRSVRFSTHIVTVTMGENTGLITMTQTLPPVVETVTVTGKCGGGGGAVTSGAVTVEKTVTFTAQCTGGACETVTVTAQCSGNDCATAVAETVTVTGQCTAAACETAAAQTVTVIETTCPVSQAAETTEAAEVPLETVYVTETVDAAATDAALILKVRRGFGRW